MKFQILKKALQNSNISHLQFRVYAALLCLSGYNEIRPSLKQLCERTTIKSRTTISRNLRALEKAGLIEIIQRGNKLTNLYKIINLDKSNELPFQSELPDYDNVVSTEKQPQLYNNIYNNSSDLGQRLRLLIKDQPPADEKWFPLYGKLTKVVPETDIQRILNYCIEKGKRFENGSHLLAYFLAATNNKKHKPSFSISQNEYKPPVRRYIPVAINPNIKQSNNFKEK